MTTTTRPAPTPRVRRMTLDAMTNAPIIEPDRIFLYGIEKIGKTTFGACAPAPAFVSAERGLAEVTPRPFRFPEAETFQDVLDAIEELTTKPHDFQTAVFDSLDWIEQLIAVAVCARCRTKSGAQWTMKEFTDYGAGQKIAVEDWRKFLLALDRLQAAKGMEVILIAHSTTKPFDDPTGISHTRYGPEMTGKIGPQLVKQWVKSILFARYEYTVHEGEGFEKAKAKSTGRRIIHTQWNAAFDAGSRYELPPILALNYVEYAAAREAGRVASPERLLAEAQGLATEWNPTGEAAEKFTAALAAATGDPVKLARIVDLLRTKIAEKEST